MKYRQATTAGKCSPSDWLQKSHVCIIGEWYTSSLGADVYVVVMDSLSDYQMYDTAQIIDYANTLVTVKLVYASKRRRRFAGDPGPVVDMMHSTGKLMKSRKRVMGMGGAGG